MEVALQLEQPLRMLALSSAISREKSLPNTAFPRLRGAVAGRFFTAFLASPSSFLDLGQAKALINCAYYSDQYHGRLVIRIDDAGDPIDYSIAYENAILHDLEMLGITPDSISHTSDHFIRCEQMAERLIILGRAYIDVVPDPLSHMSDYNRSCRGRPPAESLLLFRRLCVGAPEGRSYLLRARAGFSCNDSIAFGCSNSQVLRQQDPIIYQHGNGHLHYRTGPNFSAYPTRIFAQPIADAFEGITHTLLSTEEDDLFYTWVQRSLSLLPIIVSSFGKVEMADSCSTKHQSDTLVNSPTISLEEMYLPSLRDLMRRGMSMVPLRAHLLSLGASKRTTQIKWESLWSANRKFLEPLAPRFMAVRNEGCVRMSVARMPPGITSLTVPMHPRNDALGTRTLHVSNNVILDGQDAESIEEGEEVTLLRWTSVLVTCIHRNFSLGNMLSLESEYLPVFKFLKKKKAVTWLADCGDLIPLKLIQFGPSLNKSARCSIESDISIQSPSQRCTTVCIDALGDPALGLLKENDLIQLERLGFFRVDIPFASSHEPMVLFMIPDGKNKNKSSIDPHAIIALS
jgi:glutamyl-tRNA synthetase